MRAFFFALVFAASAFPIDAAAQPYRVGDAVSIQWSASWWPGQVLAVDGERYQVRYDGYDASWDEWVTAARLRPPEAPPAPPATPPVAPSPQTTTTAPPSASGIHGTWQYQSWIANRQGQPRGELMNGDVFYWLTLRPNGSWLLSNTTRWSPNTSETVAWGTYTHQGGHLVLTQSGTPASTYGRYTVQQSGTEMTLRDVSAGDVIVLRRGRG